MIALLIFTLPLLAMIACLALNRLVDTRVLGLGGAAVMLIAAGLMVMQREQGDGTLLTQPWISLDGQDMVATLRLDAANTPLALVVALGGALALAALALALPAKLRGYGSMIAALLMLFVTTLTGLVLQDMLLGVIPWAALPLLGFIALRSSGGQNEAQELPVGLLGNLLGAVMLLGALLSVRFAPVGTAVPGMTLLGLLVASLLALGLPPFHRTTHDMALGPANIAGPLMGLGLPLLCGFLLTRFMTQNALPAEWRAALQIAGLAGVVICAAAALRERRLRRLAGWLASTQMGLLLIVLGLDPAVVAAIAPALQINAALVTLTALLAVALIERSTGTDSMDEIRLGAPMLLPALAFFLAAASAVGVPGTWGFWIMRWLLTELVGARPLLIGPLLAGMALFGMAWLAPLAAFLRAPHTQQAAPAGAVHALPLLGALPLVLFGIAPGLAWERWGAAARTALVPHSSAAAPLLPSLPEMLACALALLALIGALVALRRRSARKTVADPELEPGGVITPDALGESLGAIGWLGAPTDLFTQLWAGMVALSSRIGWALAFFEQRYFMAGLMLALVAVILLLLQR
ncbi:hypothetical protein F8S13_06710 [Chloroflexia bacterium SDU3-3]|nr:hypothetical protein F8S13_06710 [Chloroflexia bacterium SDU3-3]